MSLLSLVKKVTVFVFRYGSADPKYLMTYCYTFFLANYKNEAIFYKDEDTISLIRQGKSLVRIGDGEVGLLHGGHVSYQEYNKDLAKSIDKIVSEYKDTEKFLLAVPQFVNFSNKDLKKTKGGIRCWLPLKIEFRRRFSKTKAYADAHLFYRKSNVQELIDYLKTRTLIVVTTKRNIEKLKSLSLFNRDTVFLISPEPNPFSEYKNIFRSIQSVLPSEHSQVTLLLSAGPLSKVLAYDFLNKDVQCIDIGIGIEVLCSKTGYEETI